MTASAIVIECRARGVELSLKGSNILLRGIRRALDELKPTITAFKPELVDLLGSRASQGSVFVWPSTIAKYSACYTIVCPRCGDFVVPYFYLSSVGKFCPSCRRTEVDCRSCGHSHYWAMRVQGANGEDTYADRCLREGLGIPDCHKVCFSFVCGPFEDEFSAVVGLSRSFGFMMGEVKA